MRIAGITLPENKRMDIALSAIYGVGRRRAKTILETAKVDLAKRPAAITNEEENKIKKLLADYKIEGALRRGIGSNIKRLIDIKSYRGSRHQRRLPARGQRTKTNARTLRGVRKTMGSGRKKLEKK